MTDENFNKKNFDFKNLKNFLKIFEKFKVVDCYRAA